MKDNLTHGAALAVGGAAAFAGMSAMVKVAGHDLPAPVIVFFRNLFALIVLAPLAILRNRGTTALRTRRPGMHLLRATVGLAGMYCFFFAIGHMPLASAVLFNYSQPLFLPFIAWAWIGEKPPARIFPAIILGFAGIAAILKPGLGWIGPASIVGLGAGLFSATAMASIRRMSDTEPALRIVLYFSALATALSAIPALIFWQTPNLAGWLALLGAGGFAISGQLMLTRAYTLAPAAHIGALVYSSVVFATLIAWAVWGETPDLLSAAGGLLVIVAALIVVFVRRPAR